MFEGILGYVFGGAIIGVLARLLKPGADPMGWIMTILLGIAGSFVAGFVGQALGWYQAGQGAGWIGSIVGALVLLFVVQKLRGSASK